MRLIPQSLGGRLLAGAALFVAMALVLAGLLIGNILARFVHGQIDQRLDAQIEAITAVLAVSSTGVLSAGTLQDAPPYDRPFSGWYWQATVKGQTIGSRSLGGGTIQVDEIRGPERGPVRRGAVEARGPHGERLVLRQRTVTIGGRTAEIRVTAPQDAIDRPLADMMTPLVLSLVALGLALIGAVALQVRFGLLPVKRLQSAVADVRNGVKDHVPEDQPAELRPLVGELNSLLTQNAQGLERARRHVANLAHGLKTPLATLAVALDDPSPDARLRLSKLVETMDRLIRHHLARARAAALGGPARARTNLAARLGDIADALATIHRGRGVTCARAVPEGLTIACEVQDLDELFGNLLDNAFRFARAEVRVRAVADGAFAVTTIEDDGVGLAEGQEVAALQPGFRFDETSTGYGFGLPIALEIAQLYGGDLTMAPSSLGGLAVSVRLPLSVG